MFEMTHLNDDIVIRDNYIESKGVSYKMKGTKALSAIGPDRKKELDLRVEEVRAQRVLEKIDPDFASQVPIPTFDVSLIPEREDGWLSLADRLSRLETNSRGPG